MRKKLFYKGYRGTCVLDDGYYCGNIPGIKNNLITFGGKTISEVEKDFKLAVEDYFILCEERNHEAYKQEWNTIKQIQEFFAHRLCRIKYTLRHNRFENFLKINLFKLQLCYKDYRGSVRKKNGTFYGYIPCIKGVVIIYEGKTFGTLKQNFENAIDKYIKQCKEQNEEPEEQVLGFRELVHQLKSKESCYSNLTTTKK